MDKNELLKYEMPSIAEWVSIGWMQTVIARYLAWKVNRKLKRYQERNLREVYLRNKGLIK